MDKYVKRSSARRRAELHTMLSGTIMIRRLKNDILKTLPKKRREKATLHVINSEEQLDEFKGLLKMLRKGKGAMGKLARKQHAEDRRSTDQEESYQSQSESNIAALGPTTATSSDTARRRDDAVMALQAEIHQRFTDGRASVQEQITQYSVTFGEEKGRQLLTQLEHQLRTSLEGVYQQQMAQINAKFGEEQAAQQETERTAVLSRLYMLSGQVKIPLVVDMLNRWLDDKTKGKICIFAHHISVLDEIEKRAKLSNAAESSRKFIRIDVRRHHPTITCVHLSANVFFFFLFNGHRDPRLRKSGKNKSRRFRTMLLFALLCWVLLLPVSHICLPSTCT